jgi:hypothetical protein
MLLIKQSLRDFCPPGVKMQFIENKQVIGVSRRCSLHRGECFFDGKSNYVIENKGGEISAWVLRNYVYENNGDIFIAASRCYFIENNRDSCDFGIRQVLFLSETRRIGGFCSIYSSESVPTAPQSEFLGTHSTRRRAQFVADTVPPRQNSRCPPAAGICGQSDGAFAFRPAPVYFTGLLESNIAIKDPEVVAPCCEN